MSQSFKITVGQQIVCSAGSSKEQFSIDYHGRFLGFIWWLFNYADWVQVGNEKLYVNRASLVLTMHKVCKAASQLKDDSSLSTTLSEQEFYTKLFGVVAADKSRYSATFEHYAKVFKEVVIKNNGAKAEKRTISLDEWIQSQVDEADSTRKNTFNAAKGKLSSQIGQLPAIHDGCVA